MNLARPLFVMIVLLLLNGCSRVTFGYNHGDWLLRYWINGYTSFDAGQKDEIRVEVAAYMRWHREHALPEYIAFLQYLEALANQDTALQPGDIVHMRSEIGRLYKLTVTPLIRPAAHVLSTLTSRQIDELRTTLADQNREQQEELLPGSEQENLAARAKGYIHFTENLVGNLSAEQENKIREMSMRIPFATRNYLEHKEAMQAGLIALLNSHASEERIASYFLHWYDPTPAQARQAEAYDKAMNDMIARTWALLTPKQKDHLRQKISGYVDDLNRLHAAKTAESASLTAQPAISAE
jgi:hypothetical protein